jgi:heme-degrading monooxygenase HmoA
MPALEVTLLRLRGFSANDPVLLQSLSTVRDKLHTHSQFYNSIEDPAEIYVLGVWPSLEAHLEFLASPARNDVLGSQESLLEFCWTVHVEMGSMDLLPLDAPVLVIEKLDFSGDRGDAYVQAVTDHVQKLRSSHRFKVAHGWRCDLSTGSHEALVFSGWDTAQAYVTLTTKEDHTDGNIKANGGVYEKMKITLARNLEYKES